MLLMVFTRDDQVTKIFVNDLNCKTSKNYNSAVSVPCPFPISSQAFRKTLLDMVLLTQLTGSLHKQRASRMKKSICYFFSPTCCSSAHKSMSAGWLTCFCLARAQCSAEWSSAGCGCRAQFASGMGEESSSRPTDQHTRAPHQQLLSTASCHGECSPGTPQIQPPFLRSQKRQGSIFA